MAATPTVVFITTLYSDDSSPEPSLLPIKFSSFTFFLFLTLFILILTLTLCTILKNNNHDCFNVHRKEQSSITIHPSPVKDDENATQLQKQETGHRPGPESVARKLFFEILPSNSPKWDTLFSKGEEFDDDPVEKSGSGQAEKKRKQRAKKKKTGPDHEGRKEKEDLVCFFPFTKSSSATQRKIKQQYDQLFKAHGTKGLTLDQVKSHQAKVHNYHGFVVQGRSIIIRPSTSTDT